MTLTDNVLYTERCLFIDLLIYLCYLFLLHAGYADHTVGRGSSGTLLNGIGYVGW